MEFAGKVALVTGAASGLGRACAFELSRGGARLALVDVASERVIAETAHALAASETPPLIFSADVREHREAARIVGEVVGQMGALDILVNAAGITDDAPLWKMTEEQWTRVLDVNLKGTFNYMRAVSPVLRERRAGKIVNISSIEALRGRFGISNYAASKAGVIALTRSAAAELGRFNVNVNAVAPGFIRTPLVERLPEDVRREAVRQSALGRIGEPEDVAHLVAFLCSDKARHITGEVIRIDGGQLG